MKRITIFDSKDITFGAIAAAISIVLLFLTQIFAFNRIFFTGAATLVFPIISVLRNKKTAIISLVAASLLALLLHPNKMLAAAFVLLGIYALLKSVIEKTYNLPLRWGIKIALYFLGATAISYVFFNMFMTLPILLGAAVFVIYDIALSIGINYLSGIIKIS